MQRIRSLSGFFFVYDLGMKKRTVWFGTPVIVVRGVVVTIGLFTIVIGGGWKLVLLAFEHKWIPMEMLIDRPWLLWMLMLAPIGMTALSWVLATRVSVPITRFQKLRGRMCFVCGYEIADGLDCCSECGARWSLDDLSKGWRKMAEGKE